MKKLVFKDGISCSDTLECVLDLHSRDIDVYKRLLRRKKRVDEISKEVAKDRSTVHRSLQRLVKCGICIKEKHTLKKGGHYYVYSAVPAQKTKEMLNDCIEKWHKKIIESLNKFENEVSMDE